MAKNIKLNYLGNEYTLQFTRKSIEIMERQGFKAEDLTEKPMLTVPFMFAGAFLANHRYLKREIIDEIFSNITNKQELIGKLAELYNEPLTALMDDPEESEKNVEWEASF